MRVEVTFKKYGERIYTGVSSIKKIRSQYDSYTIYGKNKILIKVPAKDSLLFNYDHIKAPDIIRLDDISNIHLYSEV